FPQLVQELAPWIMALGVLNIIYGALVATKQIDMKKVIAYSSVSHMGFVLLGLGALNAAGIGGAIFQLVSHGLITAMLFLGVGIVYDHTHTREVPKLGGLAARMPLAAFLFAVASLASLGLPGMSGFLAEFMTFLGAFSAAPLWTLLAASGIIVTAFYMLWLIQRVYFQEARPQWAEVTDCTPREALPMAILAVLVVLFGCYPTLLTSTTNPFVMSFLSRPGL
ncbi:MAG: NADH-quinone oxidoreductase subunit M, partial [Cyanobacteria bacterium NC_groundwater_1444_Ag_S-0.65um_54_12]|nr:NADH-quinone oxidoreductase subunit M [Cyanobacteria bacterium NC_groundwater_1444_Ag_S-0.65um_54_12]